jgi:hypothetical protein
MSGRAAAGQGDEISPRSNWNLLFAAAGRLLADNEENWKSPNFQGRTSPLGWATKWSR